MSWERYQQSRKRKGDEKGRELLTQINFAQRSSESRKTASQIILAIPGAWKVNTWRGVRRFLLSGESC